MTAGEYIQFVVHPDHVPNAVVMVSHARRGVHTVLKPQDQLPPDDEDTQVFIRIPDTA